MTGRPGNPFCEKPHPPDYRGLEWGIRIEAPTFFNRTDVW